MGQFIPDITTTITVNVHSDQLDEALNQVQSNQYLSQIDDLVEKLQEKKSKLESLKEPVAYAVAEALQSNQEEIISTKHFITGRMVGSVEISSEGDGYQVGNTATSDEGFPYPLAINNGRRGGYEVRPVRAKALHWYGKSGEVFAKVSHPGPYGGDPYVQYSINETISQIEDIVTKTLGGTVK